MNPINNASKNVRLIAFYLPQFHPIPENDDWWGKGFTEWTNVVKAKPLFSGHHQPNVPADLGFYDLRVPEVRIAQANLARDHGIEGFCYWHYWFAGKRLLERPFNEVLKSGQPDFPFCLAWANQTWTGIWHGAPNRILIKQTYPGRNDYEAHFNCLLKAFTDDRYIKVDSKPVFIVYAPHELPNPKLFTDCWRELAYKSGLKGIYLLAQTSSPTWKPEENGFDATVTDTLSDIRSHSHIRWHHKGSISLFRFFKKLFSRSFMRLHIKACLEPTIMSYKDVIETAFMDKIDSIVQYPCVIPNWDNTPRSNYNGLVFFDATPEHFRQHLNEAIQLSLNMEKSENFVFIKSWNEWAEGNYIEPDVRYGKLYLEVIKNACS